MSNVFLKLKCPGVEKFISRYICPNFLHLIKKKKKKRSHHAQNLIKKKKKTLGYLKYDFCLQKTCFMDRSLKSFPQIRGKFIYLKNILLSAVFYFVQKETQDLEGLFLSTSLLSLPASGSVFDVILLKVLLVHTSSFSIKSEHNLCQTKRIQFKFVPFLNNLYKLSSDLS